MKICTKRYAAALLLTVLASSLSALHVQADTLDDFEGYANNADLQAAWTIVIGAVPTLETDPANVFGGTKSMQVDASFFVFPIQVNRFSFGTPQNFSAATSVNIRYLGSAANDALDIELQLINSSGMEIVDAVAVGGTTDSGWQQLSIALFGQTGLDDVAGVQVGRWAW